MHKDQVKKILKIAAVVYIVSFFVINWNDVSWIFNYREVSGLVSDFFNPYPSIDARSINPYFYPNHSSDVASNTIQSKPIAEIRTNHTNRHNAIEIPKISIVAPIIFSNNADNSLVHKDLDSGVVYYPGSVYPGQSGQIVILGHSAPLGWPKVKYDWVFTDIDKLEAGDAIYIDINNKQYMYIVKKKMIIKKGADVPTLEEASSSNVLTLISCWPPGKDYQRIAVIGVLQNAY